MYAKMNINEKKKNTWKLLIFQQKNKIFSLNITCVFWIKLSEDCLLRTRRLLSDYKLF